MCPTSTSFDVLLNLADSSLPKHPWVPNCRRGEPIVKSQCCCGRQQPFEFLLGHEFFNAIHFFHFKGSNKDGGMAIEGTLQSLSETVCEAI